MKRILNILILTAVSVNLFAQTTPWSEEEAWQWYNSQPWFCGTNYIPAYAINYTAMIDPSSFDAKAIDGELQLMENLGMNCARFVLQYIVYQETPKAFFRNFEKILRLCDKHHIKAMPIFFDDCAFGVNRDPVAGKQVEPYDGWYAWAWSPSPGHTLVLDPQNHPKLEAYVKDIMERYRDDDRIMLWDLYNEPSVSFSDKDDCLLAKVIKWAREINPTQPLSICLWDNGVEGYEEFVSKNVDVITFHCYGDRTDTENHIAHYKSYGRPVICTEWMNRPSGSTIMDVLPLFDAENAGCLMWGLVNGKDQTNLPWGHRPEMLPYTGPWQHDLFHGDHTPYDMKEIDLIKNTIKNKRIRVCSRQWTSRLQADSPSTALL